MMGSAGRPTLHVETRIVDDAMATVAPGEVGEIVHRSPQLLSGYWNDPELTAEAFAGGWFHSGDLGVADADCKKDMIKTCGENVASREVEEVFYRHAAISEVAAIRWSSPRICRETPAAGFPRANCAPRCSSRAGAQAAR